ncbi:MAG TPA: hypothetical protein VFF40_01795 [Acidimicrobiia bacterium]|nr:hypothetical protein [Acidimicrobiia bacterium]
MGSSGMKRKRRDHLPKVGTPEERAWEQRESRYDVMGNFGVHPERGGAARVAYYVVGVVAVLVVVVAVISFIALD